MGIVKTIITALAMLALLVGLTVYLFWLTA